MAEQITVKCQPKQLIYTNSNAYRFTSKSWDNDLNTCDSNDSGNPATLLMDLSAVPKNAVIKKVKYRLYLYRTDNAAYCKLETALGYADSLTASLTAQHRVTDYKNLDLTDWKKYQWNKDEYAEQNITSTQSAQLLQAKYPILWMNCYGSMRYYEIYVDVTYEIPVGELYVGDQQATEVYVGTKKASAVYIGDTKVL